MTRCTYVFTFGTGTDFPRTVPAVDENLILPFYTSRLLLTNLPSLANRRTMLGTVIVYNLIRGEIDSPDLVS